MLEPLFFSLGVVNSVALIVIFVLRSRRLDLVERFGWLYLLLAIPAAYGLVLVGQEHTPAQYAIFLSIFLAFLAIEALYDWVLKIPFRQHMDWRLLAPYAALLHLIQLRVRGHGLEGVAAGRSAHAVTDGGADPRQRVDASARLSPCSRRLRPGGEDDPTRHSGNDRTGPLRASHSSGQTRIGGLGRPPTVSNTRPHLPTRALIKVAVDHRVRREAHDPSTESSSRSAHSSGAGGSQAAEHEDGTPGRLDG